MDEEFAKGDELASAGDTVALEYGWWANEWLNKEAKESNADGLSRAAFSYALTVLEERHGRFLSRSQITDRIRIGRAFPKEDYCDVVEELHYKPTFSQLRAAYVQGDRPKTMELLVWAAENDAEPLAINSRKMGDDPETGDMKAWRHVVEWSRKYLGRCDGLDETRCRLTREIVEEDEKSSKPV